jgi:hypothetical protein
MRFVVVHMAADDDVLAARSLYYADHIRHANYSSRFIKNGIILNLEILSLAQCFINWISLQHKRHFCTHIKTYDIVILHVIFKLHRTRRREYGTFFNF